MCCRIAAFGAGDVCSSSLQDMSRSAALDGESVDPSVRVLPYGLPPHSVLTRVTEYHSKPRVTFFQRSYA